MSEPFPYSHLTLEDFAEIHRQIIRQFDAIAVFRNVCDDYQHYPAWWRHTRQTLRKLAPVQSEYGWSSTIHDHDWDYGFYFRRMLSVPVSFISFEIWAMNLALMRTELKFLTYCRTPKNEVTLSASLTTMLDLFADQISETYRQDLAISDALLNLSKLELQVQNREKSSGGDFALILEWRDADGELRIAPVIFQAKRVSRELADISQFNETTQQYQLDVLRRSRCNPAYLFYHCDTQKITETPRLPTVKPVDAITLVNGKYETSAVEDCLSFSLHLLSLMADRNTFVVNSRQAALQALLPEAKENELDSVMAFSVDPAAAAAYKAEYQHYLAAQQRATAKKKPGSGPGRKP